MASPGCRLFRLSTIYQRKGTVNRFRSAFAVAAVAAVLLLVAPPVASAVEPPKPPVIPFAELPSKLLASFQSLFTHADATGSPAVIGDYNPATHGDLTKYPVGSIGWQEEAAKAEAYLASKGYANPNTKLPSAVSMGKTSTSLVASARSPLTLPGLVGRAAGGGVALAGIAGFALGQGGLAVYAASSGNDPWAAMCNGSPTDVVLSDIQRSINFGIGPDCTAPVLDPNVDKPGQYLLEYGGVSVWKGQDIEYFGPQTCWFASGPPPAGTTWEMYNSSTSSWSSITYPAENRPECTGSNLTQRANAYPINRTGARFISSTTGAVLATGVNVSPNPTRTTNCTIDFKDGSVTSNAGPSYNDTGGLPVGGIGAACSAAWSIKNGGSGALVGAGRIRVTSTDTSSGGATTTLLDQPVSPSTAEQQRMVDGTSTGPNPGRGLILTLTVAGVTDNCLTWAANCSGWWAETENGTVATHGNRTYTCSFDGATVALGECVVYKTTFDNPTATPVVTDPVTGTETDWQTGPIGTNPGNTGNPGTMPNGSTDPHGDCMSEWPGAPDPISWVLHPVKCALVWAFVPRSSVVSGVQTAMAGGFGGSVLGSVAGGVEQVAGGFAMAEGCEGLPLHLEAFGTVIVHTQLLRACEEPFAGTAAVVKGLLTVACVITAILAFTRYLGSTFAFASFGNSKGNDSGVSFK